MKKILFFFLGVALFAACNTAGEQQPSEEDNLAAQEQLWDEVMATHDEVMPQMSEIKRLERELGEYVGEESQLDAEMQEKINQTIQQLETAGEGMMSWMSNIRQLEPLRKEMDHEGVMNYLEEEKEKIDKVKNDMVRSIEDGSALLNELKSEEG